MEVDRTLARTLQLLAEGVIEFAGFRVAAVSLVEDGALHTVAVVGDDSAAAQLLDWRAPVELVERELAPAEVWGALRFLPADRASGHLDQHTWVPDVLPLDLEDAWHPQDLLCGLLHDDDGRLRGLLSVDLPTSGRRPDQAQRATLQMYVRLAERALVTSLERDDLAILVEREHAVAEYRRSIIDVLSHELRGTAAAIAHTVESLRDDPALADDVAAALGVVHGGAERLRSVVDDMAALTKLGRSDTLLRAVTTDLGELASEAVGLHRAEARSRAVEVELDAPAGATLVGDPDDLARMVANLVSNAVKYSEPGGRVLVRVQAGQGCVALVVNDRGIGIADAERERVFDEFFRSPRRAVRRRPGAGLGLAIVRRVVALHGGAVRVASALGEGATFTVELPRAGAVPDRG